LNENSKVLDIGCGTGRHLLEFSKFTSYVFGTDISSKMLNYAKEKLKNGSISNTDINKLISQLNANYAPNKEMKALIDQLQSKKTLGASDIDKLQKWANRRNELWARNEAGNLYANQLQDLWLENGIEKYIWRTMEDNYVRMEHVEKDGKIFGIDEDILPGQEFGCRCWAEPVKQGGNKE